MKGTPLKFNYAPKMTGRNSASRFAAYLQDGSTQVEAEEKAFLESIKTYSEEAQGIAKAPRDEGVGWRVKHGAQAGIPDLDDFLAFRWWSAAELAASGEHFVPYRLPALLPPLLAALRLGRPPAPSDVGA